MMQREFGEIAPQLVSLGYQPIPIAPGTKRPPMKRWPEFRVDDAALQRYRRHGVGLLTGSLVGIDADVLDAGAAAALQALARTELGDGPVRIGRAPKFLMAVRTASPIRKRQTKAFIIAGAVSRVEVLADGQQFVAFAVHPDTKLPYQWSRGDPLGIAFDDLPEVTEAQIDAFLVQAEAILAKYGTPEKPARMNGGADHQPTIQAATGPGRRYSEAAFADEIKRVATTAAGGRNNALNNASLKLGQLVAGRWLDQGRVERALVDAGVAAGLAHDDGGIEGIRATVRSGLEAGLREPRNPPERGAVLAWRGNGASSTAASETPAVAVRGAMPAGDGADAEPQVSMAPEPAQWPTGINYPAELWAARPWLTQLRNYAIARTLDPDLLLGACLARFAALLPKGTAMDTGMMSGQASLNLLVAAIGPSGRGKSCAIDAAALIVPAPGDMEAAAFAEGALGSGQGLAECYMGEVCTNPDAPKKGRKYERRQVRHNAFCWLDEGQTLTRLAQHATNITMPTLRSAAMGSPLGALNAGAEHRRKVSTYHLGVYIGYQPCTVGPLLAEVREGTPQRFLFCAIGPAPDVDLDDCAHPVLDQPPAHVPVMFVEAVRQEIRARHLARLRDTHLDLGPDWQSHAGLLQCKVAGLLCLIDHRQFVTSDDWHLASIVCETSHAIIRWLREEEARQREDEDLARIATRAAGAQASAVAVQQAPARIETLAQRLAAKVHEHGRVPKGDARANYFRSTMRHLFDAACDAAAQRGWVLLEEHHVAPGPETPA